MARDGGRVKVEVSGQGRGRCDPSPEPVGNLCPWQTDHSRMATKTATCRVPVVAAVARASACLRAMTPIVTRRLLSRRPTAFADHLPPHPLAVTPLPEPPSRSPEPETTPEPEGAASGGDGWQVNPDSDHRKTKPF